jgi:hypothetical protein
MTKRTDYSIKYYHYSEGEAMQSLAELCSILEGLLPEAEVNFESCKSDFGLLTISFEEEFDGGDYN